MVSVLTHSLQRPALTFTLASRVASVVTSSIRRTARSQIGYVRKASAAAAQMDQPTVGHELLLEALRAVVPKLDTESYKGQAGKIGVMGGCREYTGAPFFSAMSALRMGCDLAYVFCTAAAAPVIKSYSPELIVLPCLPTEPDTPDVDENEICKEMYDKVGKFERDISSWLAKLSVLVIGPGLGDDYWVGQCMEVAVKVAKERNLPLIIDGSGINFVAQHHHEVMELVKGYSNCVLTPNIAEFGRLAKALKVELPGKIGTNWQQHTAAVAAALEGPILLSKGPQDVISNGHVTIKVTADGSPRRCGGQGDVLTGTTAAFVSWILAHQHKQQQRQQQDEKDGTTPAAAAAGVDIPPFMLAAYGGCLTMRAAAVLSYRDMGRSMVAGDMIQHLGDKALDFAGLQPEGSSAPKL